MFDQIPADLETAFDEGKRAVFLHVAAVLALDAGNLGGLETPPAD